MASVESLITALNPSEWRSVLSSYEFCLQTIASKKTKKDSSNELIRLDKWFQEDLPSTVASRNPPHIQQTELVELMKWKLLRGKFRPRLVELAASNKEEDVVAISTKAFKQIKKNQLKAAIETASKLRGVGPATASAILSVGCPDEAAFMSDESVWGLLGKQSLKYNLSEYLEYMSAICKCRDGLNKKDSTPDWTAHGVELCVWTIYQAENNGFTLDTPVVASVATKAESTCHGVKRPKKDKRVQKKRKM